MRTLVSTNLFMLRYNWKYIRNHVANRYLGSPTHPINPKIAHMYAHREENNLWWTVSVQPLMSYRRVVRSWCARRTRVAFKQALRERGFNWEGRRLLGKMATPTMTPSELGIPGDDLTGTVELIVHPPCVKEKFPVIQKEMSFIVDALLGDHQLFRNRRRRTNYLKDKNTQGVGGV